MKKCEPAQAEASGQPSHALLKIGTLLPETGSLAFLGLPEFAAIDVASKEINVVDEPHDSPHGSWSELVDSWGTRLSVIVSADPSGCPAELCSVPAATDVFGVCPRCDSNAHWTDFEAVVSADWTTGAHRFIPGAELSRTVRRHPRDPVRRLGEDAIGPPARAAPLRSRCTVPEPSVGSGCGLVKRTTVLMARRGAVA